nr:hypothetical protein [Cyanobacteria bacterium RUI128]
AAGCTIETYKTKDKDKLDILEWKKIITGRVANWLENNSSVEGENLSFHYYSVIGVMKAIEEGKVTLTKAQYQSLLNCYKVSYSEVPESKEFNSTAGDETYTFGSANNTVIYSSANMGKDVINSSPTEFNESYLDRIKFTTDAGLSVKDGTLAVKAVGNDLVIGKAGDLENNSVTYKDFFSSDKVNKVNNTILYDSSGDKYYLRVNDKGIGSEDRNHIEFVYNNDYSHYAGFGTGRNYIYSYGENEYYYDETTKDNISMWVCSYGGGTDTVVSYSETGSDNYQINKFNEESKLIVTDMGGANDSLYIGYNSPAYEVEVPIIDQIRWVFDVTSAGGVDYNSFMFVHEDVLNSTTLKTSLTQDLVSGVLKYNAASTTENSFGIEKFTYFISYDEDETGYSPWKVEVDTDTWKAQIVQNVQAWLTSDANSVHYTSAYQTFENASGIDISGLVTAYNVDYTQLNA